VPDPDLLTLTQVAERLQVSRWTIYQLIWAGELRSVHIGRCHRVRARDSTLTSNGSDRKWPDR
jgi:excisionase family DNA binding protein